MEIIPEDWGRILLPETALLELVARGSLLYFGILVLMRILPRRTGGELATMDLIFIVLIADAAARSIGEYTTVADGAIVILTLVLWNYLVNVLSFRFRLIEWLTSSPPLRIVRDGQLLRRNLRRELITEEELMSHLREQGIDDLRDVKEAYVEGEGKITAIRRKE